MRRRLTDAVLLLALLLAVSANAHHIAVISIRALLARRDRRKQFDVGRTIAASLQP